MFPPNPINTHPVSPPGSSSSWPKPVSQPRYQISLLSSPFLQGKRGVWEQRQRQSEGATNKGGASHMLKFRHKHICQRVLREKNILVPPVAGVICGGKAGCVKLHT